MSNSYVFFNGHIMDESEACIGVRNMAFNYGLGCFEGIRAYWNDKRGQLYVYRMQDHYARLLRSCHILNINIHYSLEQMCRITLDLLRMNRFKNNVYIRPIAYKGGNSEYPQLLDPDNELLIYIFPIGDIIGKDGVRICTSSWTKVRQNMIPPMAKATACYLNSALASTEAKINGFDEAVLLTANDNVSEGPGENIFIIRGGTLITPPITDDILEGITRDTVIRLAREELGIKTIIRSIPRTELYSAEEAFYTGTAIEIKPIVEIDRRSIGTGDAGPITEELMGLYAEVAYGNSQRYNLFNTPVYIK